MFLILLLMKRQLLLPVILVLSIETAIWINLAIPYFRGRHVFYIAYLIISTIQLGATVDYAILFSDRYQEFRETLDKKQAIAATVSTVTTSVITTGSALAVVGFLIGGHLHQPAAGPAGQLPGCGRSGVAGHRAAGAAGLSVSGRPAHHQTEKTAEGGLTR